MYRLLLLFVLPPPLLRCCCSLMLATRAFAFDDDCGRPYAWSGTIGQLYEIYTRPKEYSRARTIAAGPRTEIAIGIQYGNRRHNTITAQEK